MGVLQAVDRVVAEGDLQEADAVLFPNF